MIIPCIKNKCLKYPACRNKNYIQCSELSIYYWKMRETHSIEYTWEELFKQLGGVTTINITMTDALNYRLYLKSLNLEVLLYNIHSSHNPEEY